MKAPRLAILLALLSGCSKTVPAHLQIKPSTEVANASAPIEDLPSALAAMVRKDPLARAPKLPDPSTVEAVEGGAPIAAYIRRIIALERGDGQVERDLQELEQEYPRTAVVALSRGYRLRVVENLLANLGPAAEDAESRILELLTPLHANGNDDTLPRPPLDWLARGQALPGAVRNLAERWVLTAWLRAPEIPLEVIGPQMRTPLFDGLAQTPTGELVLARIDRLDGPTVEGLDDLHRATVLALTRAAADRDSEQASWSDLKKTNATALETDKPVAFLLERATQRLTAAAADDTAVGGALLAIGARRWEDSCAIAPCVGVDRVETMATAAAWGDTACLSETWQVIALKESLDTMDVGHDTILFPDAMLDVVDSLLGTGAGPLEVQLLRRRRPDPAVWLALGRAVGREAVTDWAGARVALGSHLESKATKAASTCDDPQLAPLLTRIIDRAVP